MDTSAFSLEYYQIYKWVYTEGNFSDKLGLARNIISLNIQDENNPLLIPATTFPSLRTNHEIYLKRNIEKYIEVKNKLSEYLISSSQKASKITDQFASSFKTSSFSFLSFFLSVVVIKLLKGEQLSFLFTEDMKNISVAILAVAFLYFLLSLWDVLQEKDRFMKSFLNFKNSYTDLLDSHDLDNIFDHNKQFAEDMAFVQTKICLYSGIWICVFLAVSLIIFWLG